MANMEMAQIIMGLTKKVIYFLFADDLSKETGNKTYIEVWLFPIKGTIDRITLSGKGGTESSAKQDIHISYLRGW